MKKNVLVTGGAGFIGSVLARTINIEHKHEIAIVDQIADKNAHPNMARMHLFTRRQPLLVMSALGETALCGHKL